MRRNPRMVPILFPPVAEPAPIICLDHSMISLFLSSAAFMVPELVEGLILVNHVACERREICYMALIHAHPYGARRTLVFLYPGLKFSSKISQPGLLASGHPYGAFCLRAHISPKLLFSPPLKLMRHADGKHSQTHTRTQSIEVRGSDAYTSSR